MTPAVDNNTCEENDDCVPDQYLLPSFMAFVLWGPFVEPEKRLSLLVSDDAHKSTVKSRRERRKADLDLKSSERKENTTGVIGFSTDQRISIELMNIQKESVRDRKRESKIVALSIQQRSILIYDKDNTHWKRVDNWIEEQDQVMAEFLNFDKEENDSKRNEGDIVSDFLNLDSPSKKKAHIDLSDDNDDSNSNTVPGNATGKSVS